MRRTRCRTWIARMLILVVFASVAACGSGAATDESGDRTVSLAAFRASFVNFPVYVAEAEGIFASNGLDTQITYATGKEVTNALASNSVDFAAFAVEHGIALASKGQDVKLIALNQTATPFTMIVANDVPTPNADAPFPQNLVDLKGLTLAVSSAGSSTDNTLRSLLRQAGLDPDQDVTIVPVGGPGPQIAALKQGSIDGTIAFEPIQTQAVFEQKIAKPVLDLQGGEGPAIYQEYAYNGVFAKADWLKDNEEAGRSMVASIVEAQEFIQDPANSRRLIEIAAEYIGGEETSLRHYLDEYRTVFSPSATPVAISNVNDAMVEAAVIDDPVPYDTLVSPLMPEQPEAGR